MDKVLNNIGNARALRCSLTHKLRFPLTQDSS